VIRRVDGFEGLGEVEGPLCLALGVFDGVHVGHRAVIGRAVKAAAACGATAGVLTFEPHPIRLLAPEKAPRRLLASVEHKQAIVGEMGVGLLVVVPFTREFAGLEAGEFVAQLVAAASGLRMVGIGEDWKFGKGRGGDVGLLRSEGEKHDFEVVAVPPVMMQGERVSSTRIRQAIRDGNLDAAARMLGRRYGVAGVVIEGRKLGRTIGFPTVNLAVADEQMPPEGVWKVKVRVDGAEFEGVANLGRRPTLGGTDRTLEAHLFDFDSDLYGRWIEVEFGSFLREERKFGSVEELREQIEADVARARATG
jgi:riboflavin kinase/FMN adenylyltransferase